MADGVLIRMRMSQADAHYGGNLVDGARMLQLFGDVATELLIRHDGDEGLFRAYDQVEFLVPVARQTTTGSARTSAALSESSGRGTITLRTSKRMVREVLPTLVISPVAST